MPYWRISSFYFFYFGALGVLVPYWGLYLQSLGFSPAQIGQLLAILMGTKIIAPYLWGWLGDHLGHRMRIVRAGALSTVVVFVSIFWLTDYWGVALAMALFSFFWNAILPQFEVVSLHYLGARSSHYARLRVWGSIGFIVTVTLVGVWVDWRSPAVVPLALLLVFIAIWIASLTVADPAPEPHPQEQPPLLTILRRPAVIAFFLVCFLSQISHAVYYAFYSIYLEGHGYSKTLIGQLWSLGVVAEVVIFLLMHRLLHHCNAGCVLTLSLLLATLRWGVIGWFPQSLALLLFAQLLHAFTFGTFHVAAIHLIHRYFVGRHQGRGQALYAGVSFGAGGAVGSLLAGYLWQGVGPRITFELAALVASVAALIAWYWVAKRDLA